jgi:site-specific recombinase XerD
MSKKTEIIKLKQEFLEYIEIERGRSVKTVENYDRYLTRFFEHAEIKKPSYISADAVREFRLWLNRQPAQDGGSIKRRTQNYYLIALRAFLKYLRKRGVKTLEPEQIELAKLGEREVDFIAPDELARLLKAPHGDSLTALRDRAILETLFSTGLRVAELTSLNRDINLNRDEITVRGKGDKLRVVFLSDGAKKTLTEYLKKRDDIDDALFVQTAKASKDRSTRLTTRSIERIVKKYAVAAGITKKVSPHTIRHSFATDLLHNGADIRSVQALLGHASINTTQVYTHVTDKHLRDIHKKFHGKART